MSGKRTLRLGLAACVFSLLACGGWAQGVGDERAGVAAPAGGGQAEKKPTVTDRLQVVYSRLTNQASELAAFATKADEEKDFRIGSLLRAAARSSQLSANLIAEQIRQAGGKPEAKPEPKPVDVKGTKDNLKAAAARVRSLRDGPVADGTTQANAERNRDAVRVLRFARESSTELVRWLEDAAEGGAQWTGETREFFVDRTCGRLVDKLDFERCPVCQSRRDSYERVN
ncbi:MAG: hypothetical protein ACK51N_05340 [bacterium]